MTRSTDEHRDPELRALERRIQALEVENESLRATQQQIFESISWRLTVPVRKLGRIAPARVRRIARSIIVRPMDLVRRVRRVLGRGRRALSPRKLYHFVTGRSASGASLFFNHRRSERWVRRKLAARAARTLAETRPLVSVIVPTRDRARSILPAIESVLAQSYGNFELLVVDDGSRDNTVELIQSRCSDPRLKLLQSGGQGVCAARNCGLREARGDFIAYLDSDNTWTGQYLELMLISLLESGADCAYAALKCVNAVPEFYRQQRFDYEQLKLQNYIDLNVFVHTRAALDRVGLFDAALKRMVDWDFILRVAKSERVVFAEFVGAHYDAGPAPDRITNAESPSYQNVVRNKHWVDWARLELEAPRRDPALTSIVICVYDQPELTEACLRSLYRDRAPGAFEVILVDNGSDAATKRVLARWARAHANIALVTNPVNFNFSLGNNVGFAASRGANVIFLNNDTEVTHGWAEELVRRLRAADEIGAVGPRLLYGDNTTQCAGLAFSSRSRIPYHIYRNEPGTAAWVNREREFQALTGACLAMRADDFIRLRGFSPLYVNGCEDLDLCFRLRLELGRKLIYAPTSLVYHHEGRSAGRGKFIAFNRRCFVEAWGPHVVADDAKLYAEDGFTVREYRKPGTEPDGETAAYVPLLAQSGGGGEPVAVERTIQVGVVSIWYVRGISLLAKQCCDALEEGSFRTHVLARWESDRFSNAGPVEHPRVTNGGDDPTPEETVEWARMNALDLVIFMEVHPNDWKRVRALRAAGFKVMALEMMDILRKKYVEEYACLDGFICIAQYTYDFFRARFPRIPALLIPWGIPDVSPPQGRGGEPPRDSGRPTDELHFVHVAGWGGLNNRKNTDLLIRAFAKASPPNGRLHLYTQAPLGKYGQECEDLVRQSGCIIVHEGTMPDIRDAYAGKDMLLWPSKREGLGLPILEALAVGVPVMIADGYMMKQWIVSGEHGVVIEATPVEGNAWLPEMQVDVAVLARAIADLCRSPDVLQRFRASVERDRAVWIWSWQPEVFRRELRRILHSPGEGVDPDSYLPEFIRDFEKRRQGKVDVVELRRREVYEMQSL